jgi:F420-dependent oxidoreductase-like protein
MTTTHRLNFGIKTMPERTTYDEILRVWRATDATPAFTSAWAFDHFIPLGGGDDVTGPCLEGWTLLAALAAQTERVRVGLMVTGNTYRHPAVLANMAATVDIISGGRLDFGIGAGWNETEHAMYGIPLYAPGERIRRLGEACEVIRRLWTEDVANYQGQHYQLKDARCEPKPVQKPYPPFVIGGSGERLTLRVAAEYADIWNYNSASVEEFRHKCAVLEDHCRAIGRDPAEIERSVQVRIGPPGSHFDDVLNADDLAPVRDQLRGYIEAGATHLVLYLIPPFAPDIVARLAAEVAEPLLAGQA